MFVFWNSLSQNLFSKKKVFSNKKTESIYKLNKENWKENI